MGVSSRVVLLCFSFSSVNNWSFLGDRFFVHGKMLSVTSVFALVNCAGRGL
jgi:hypothetical protein